MLSSICDLPLEVMEHIMSFLGCEEAARTINVCNHFQRAVCYSIKSECIKLRKRINTEISSCQTRLNNLPLSDQFLRMDIVKLLLSLRFLLTEMELMFAVIWRFSYYDNIWSKLCPFLVPVIKEFYRNVERQINLQVGHLDLNIYNIRNALPKWHEFLSLFDNELGERLNSLLPVPINFELMAVDILTCCPSINFQITFDFVKDYNITNDNCIFNIYAFFKLNHLKTFCQIPNVHNVELSHKRKQYQLVKFLREIVQWENMIHLHDAADHISNLELQLGRVWDDPTRENLIKEMQDSYVNIQLIPYEPILKRTKIIYTNEERHWKEFYCRFSSYNESLTGVRCIIDIKNKKLEHLPLIYSTLNGDIKNTLHNAVSSNDLITFNDLDSNKEVIDCNSENESSILQLLILYRERLNSSPAEAIINVCYDENNACQVTLNIIESEPLT